MVELGCYLIKFRLWCLRVSVDGLMLKEGRVGGGGVGRRGMAGFGRWRTWS